MNKGIIFDLKRGSFHDGPGIRTVVFLKGCPLRCIWCHNPESLRREPELLYDGEKCLNCGQCVEICENQAHSLEDGRHNYFRNRCIVCGNCVGLCPAGALQVAGYEITDDEVVKLALQDILFYKNSGGGLTLSGGDPLMQKEFTISLLRKAKENGLHTCMDTCGYAPTDTLKMVMEYTNVFLFDIKETDSKRHKQCTGVGIKLVLDNLEYLNSNGKNIILRCPIIPGINDRNEHLEAIKVLVRKYHSISGVELLKYHELGNHKNRLLNRPTPLEIVNDYQIDVKAWEKLLNEELLHR